MAISLLCRDTDRLHGNVRWNSSLLPELTGRFWSYYNCNRLFSEFWGDPSYPRALKGCCAHTTKSHMLDNSSARADTDTRSFFVRRAKKNEDMKATRKGVTGCTKHKEWRR